MKFRKWICTFAVAIIVLFFIFNFYLSVYEIELKEIKNRFKGIKNGESRNTAIEDFCNKEKTKHRLKGVKKDDFFHPTYDSTEDENIEWVLERNTESVHKNDKICFVINSQKYSDCVKFYNNNYDKLFTKEYSRLMYDIRCALAENDNRNGCPNNENDDVIWDNGPRCLLLDGEINYQSLPIKTFQSIAKMAKPHCKYYITSDQDIGMGFNMTRIINKVKESGCKRRCYFGNVFAGAHARYQGKYKFSEYVEKFGDTIMPPYCGGAIYGFTSDILQVLKVAYEVGCYYSSGMEDAYLGSLLFGLNDNLIHMGRNGDFYFHDPLPQKGKVATVNRNIQFNITNLSILLFCVVLFCGVGYYVYKKFKIKLT